MYHSESLDSRNVHKGDGREIQDQAVEVHSGNTDACSKLFDSLESFIPLLQNFQGVKSNLKQPNVGIRVNSSKADCRGAERRHVLYVRPLWVYSWRIRYWQRRSVKGFWRFLLHSVHISEGKEVPVRGKKTPCFYRHKIIMITWTYMHVIFAIPVEVGPLDVRQQGTTRTAHTRKQHHFFIPTGTHYMWLQWNCGSFQNHSCPCFWRVYSGNLTISTVRKCVLVEF